MQAPILEALPEQSGAEGELFQVVRRGVFADRIWNVGEILLCRGEPRWGDPVVFAVRGRQGRPRLGCVEGTRFLGEAGEPCHPGRWRLCGAVVSVRPPWGEDRVADVVNTSSRNSGEGTLSGLASPHPAGAIGRAGRSQLSLFAA